MATYGERGINDTVTLYTQPPFVYYFQDNGSVEKSAREKSAQWLSYGTRFFRKLIATLDQAHNAA